MVHMIVVLVSARLVQNSTVPQALTQKEATEVGILLLQALHSLRFAS